jgi:MFS-type transporter involved in bile tolerance (Atg22 family)
LTIRTKVFVFVLVGGMADWGNLRKKMLIFFSVFGSIVTCLFVVANIPGVTFPVSTKAELVSSSKTFYACPAMIFFI